MYGEVAVMLEVHYVVWNACRKLIIILQQFDKPHVRAFEYVQLFWAELAQLVRVGKAKNRRSPH